MTSLHWHRTSPTVASGTDPDGMTYTLVSTPTGWAMLLPGETFLHHGGGNETLAQATARADLKAQTNYNYRTSIRQSANNRSNYR